MLKRLKDYVYPPPFHHPTHASEYLQVFSHPRSGTHFLEAFIARNFYQEIDLSLSKVDWGHWSNRQVNENGNPYGKLFGSHTFPTKSLRSINYPSVYIFRDGRAVAYSIWKTDNFLHSRYKGISFSDFLLLKLDWVGSPAFKCRPKYTIAEHWFRHVKGWDNLAKSNSNILFLRYEDLVKDPYGIYLEIARQFFPEREMLAQEQLSVISKPTGLLPNKAKIDSWKTVFNKRDEDLFKSQIASLEYMVG